MRSAAYRVSAAGKFTTSSSMRWTGRPPTGFTVDEDSRLRVDVESFLRLRVGIERVSAGEDRANVADDIGFATSTLKNAHTNRADLYLYGDADDEDLETAIDEITPLPEPEAFPVTSEERVRRSFATSDNQAAIELNGSVSSCSDRMSCETTMHQL